MFTEEHLYSVALRRCALIGDINFHRLVHTAGSAKEVWSLPKRELSRAFGIGSRTLSEIGTAEPLQFAENELRFCEKNGVGILLRHTADYPAMLKEAEDAPSVLYCKGKTDFTPRSVSIVGTRNVTAYGKKFLEELFPELPAENLMTVSGLAIGADTAVHELSLKYNIHTVAVLAHGFHTIYPSKNRKLAQTILEKGGTILTEFNSSQKPDRENFIQRNRIIAALSETTIVVETAFGGGSVSTVTFANNYNREVYALPGKITDKYSQGCNQLIAQLKARTISTIPGLIEEMDLKSKPKTGILFPHSEIVLQLSEEQQLIYEILKKKSQISLDELGEKTELPTQKLLALLLQLELAGHVKTHSGKQYSLS